MWLPALVFDFVQIEFVDLIVIRAFVERRLTMETKWVHWEWWRWFWNHFGPLILELCFLLVDKIDLNGWVVQVPVQFGGSQLVERAVVVKGECAGRRVKVGVLARASVVVERSWSVKWKRKYCAYYFSAMRIMNSNVFLYFISLDGGIVLLCHVNVMCL